MNDLPPALDAIFSLKFFLLEHFAPKSSKFGFLILFFIRLLELKFLKIFKNLKLKIQILKKILKNFEKNWKKDFEKNFKKI